MRKIWVILFLVLVFLISGCSSASATPAASECMHIHVTLFLRPFSVLVELFISLKIESLFCVCAEIVGGVVTNVVSALFKWLWSLKSTPKTGQDSPFSG